MADPQQPVWPHCEERLYQLCSLDDFVSCSDPMTDLVADAQQTETDSSPPFDLGVVDDTPEVAVDLARLQANIARAASAAEAHGIGLRPHVKTHKMLQVAALQMRAGAVGI